MYMYMHQLVLSRCFLSTETQLMTFKTLSSHNFLENRMLSGEERHF